ASITSPMYVLRAVIYRARIERRRFHRGYALKPVCELAARITIERLSADPVLLLVVRVHIELAELALTASVHDLRSFHVRHDGPRFAPRADTEGLSRGK